MCIGLIYQGGTDLSGIDGLLIVEAIGFGCTGISTAVLSNDLAVSITSSVQVCCILFVSKLTPVLVGGNHEQKKKYLGKMVEAPLQAVCE